jgi:hypothetical protein
VQFLPARDNKHATRAWELWLSTDTGHIA